MNLTACNLAQKLNSLEDIEGGKFDVVYASVESATDKRFLQSLKKNTAFSSSLVACVVDESHTVETWTGLRWAIEHFNFNVFAAWEQSFVWNWNWT